MVGRGETRGNAIDGPHCPGFPASGGGDSAGRPPGSSHPAPTHPPKTCGCCKSQIQRVGRGGCLCEMQSKRPILAWRARLHRGTSCSEFPQPTPSHCAIPVPGGASRQAGRQAQLSPGHPCEAPRGLLSEQSGKTAAFRVSSRLWGKKTGRHRRKEGERTETGSLGGGGVITFAGVELLSKAVPFPRFHSHSRPLFLAFTATRGRCKVAGPLYSGAQAPAKVSTLCPPL